MMCIVLALDFKCLMGLVIALMFLVRKIRDALCSDDGVVLAYIV